MKKNKILLFTILLSICVVFIFLIFIAPLLNDNDTKQNSLTQITVAPDQKMPFTGVDEDANEKYLIDHPELITEASLQSRVPLDFEGFTLDYSYSEDKFTVQLLPPFEESKIKFENWKKGLSLTNPSRFIIL